MVNSVFNETNFQDFKENVKKEILVLKISEVTSACNCTFTILKCLNTFLYDCKIADYTYNLLNCLLKDTVNT